MTKLTLKNIRKTLENAEAHRDADGKRPGTFTDTNAYEFLQCARFLLGMVEQASRTETAAPFMWRINCDPPK